MHQAASKEHALISIMHRGYQDIRAVESEYQITVDAEDLRPRIEYFHDAVRVLTEHPDAVYHKATRLSVEWLAYDLSCLRYISDKPLAKLSHAQPGGSTTSGKESKRRDLVLNKHSGAGATRMPPADVRVNLGQLYTNYTVLFAALFAETTDRNFQTRVTENNTEVEDLAQIQQMIEMLERGQVAVEQVEEVIQHLQNDEMKTRLMIMLHERSQKKRQMQDAIAQIKTQMNALDMEIASMDKAHTHYLSGQMMLLQESKEMVKKLAGQGLNLAGQFLQNSVAQSQGRGGGRGF